MTKPPTDEDLLAELFVEHYAKVVRFCFRRLRDLDAAHDAAALTFTYVWQRLDGMPQAPLPWIFRIARGVVSNELRRRLRESRLHGRLQVEHDVRMSSSAPEASRAVVLEALAKLRDEDQEVLRLRVWEGLTGEDAAIVCGCSVNAVNVRFHRARRRLRALLDAGSADLESIPDDSAANDSIIHLPSDA